MNFESPIESENPREKFVRIFKEKGEGDPETRELLQEVVDELQKQAEQSEDFLKGQIEISCALARIYLEVGSLKDAYDSFDDALEQLQYIQGEEDLEEAIVGEMEQAGLLRKGWNSQRWEKN